MIVAQVEEKQLNHSEPAYSWGDVALKVVVGALVAVAIAATGGVTGLGPLALAGVAGAAASFGEVGVINTVETVGHYVKDRLIPHTEGQSIAVTDAPVSSPEIKQAVAEKAIEQVKEPVPYVSPAVHTHHLADLQRERSQKNIGPSVGT